jgi:transcriptional regulator with XRE-family HTH domain
MTAMVWAPGGQIVGDYRRAGHGFRASDEARTVYGFYVEGHVKGGIAYQIQALREKSGLNQKDFGNQIGKPQSVVSRLESTEYGSVSVETLLDVAKALDVALQVRFSNYVEMGIADQVAVTFSPQHFKALVKSLSETLQAYEASFGALTISDADTAPIRNAAEILAMIQAAKAKTHPNPSSTEPKLHGEAISRRRSEVRASARAIPPLRPPLRCSSFAGSRTVSSISPVKILMTWTALPITSAGRFSPLGPRGIRRYLSSLRLQKDSSLRPIHPAKPPARRSWAVIPWDVRPVCIKALRKNFRNTHNFAPCSRPAYSKRNTEARAAGRLISK